jgi:hypothetical protein
MAAQFFRFDEDTEGGRGANGVRGERSALWQP